MTEALKNRMNAILETEKKYMCPGWDDNRGCVFSSNCLRCKGSKISEYENIAHHLVDEGYVNIDEIIEAVNKREKGLLSKVEIIELLQSIKQGGIS